MPTHVMTARRRQALQESMLLRIDAGRRARPTWARARACAGMPAAVFYTNTRKGPATCEQCPVRMDCLAATCAAEAVIALDEVLGYRSVSAPARVAWQA